ncbi:MAG TPA: PIG-L family deacetylase [Anaerolineae bacterium]|nr:PIG-L family deacetylase [Anaerolineae bacterium]
MSDSHRLTLMAVFAHPDDESFGTGGTLARYSADPNVRVVLICATRGEAGEISDPELATPERLGEVREEELRCACKGLGIDALFFLDYRDSGMAGTPENRSPGALIMADSNEAVGKIVAHIRRERPEVVVTFDKNGGYGHPDHIAIHHYTTAAFSAAADPTQYLEQVEAGLEPHQSQKLYYTAIPHRFFVAVVEKMQEMGKEISQRYLERLDGPWGLPDEACTTDINVQDCWDTKQKAVRCHASQLNADSIFAALPPEIMRELQAWECFQLAESFVGEDGDSHDLFAGLR